MNFNELPIIPPLQKALEKQEFITSTPIQSQVIPLAINAKDILWSAQTWSWKTLAFTIPILQNLYTKKLQWWVIEWKQTRKIQALIIAPTRELVIQIWETFAPYATNVNLKYTTIYWWVNQFHQVKAIERGVDVLIATPGRLEDLISQWVLKLSYVEIFIIDEADKMLDMWFLPDVKKIIKRLPENRQTLFFSATIPPDIKELSNSILKNPEVISIKQAPNTQNNIIQKVYHIKSSHKRQLLQQLVKRKDLESIIVFVRTKDETEYVMDYVKSAHISCDNIHRNRSQNARQRAILALKKWEIKVLIATDIASRWIDIDGLSCVINYNMPKESETYVHRIWRTARAWKNWLAISMCVNEEKVNLENIEKLIWKKLLIEDDLSYKDEIIPKTEFLWRFKAEEKPNNFTKKRRYKKSPNTKK